MQQSAVNDDTRLSNAVVLRMGQLALLAPQETATLQDLSRSNRQHPTQTELCLAGQVQPPLMLLSGWACYQRILSDGRRQIIRFILPGDPIGSLSHPALPAPCSAVALTPVVVAEGQALLRIANEGGLSQPGLRQAIAQMSHAEEVNLFDQMVRLGRHTAYERVVHLLLELHSRLQAVGMVNGDSFSVPLTQEVLADALGLSVVHTNRTLQQVRRDRLLDMHGGRVTLHQMGTMRDVAEWMAPVAA